MRDWLGVSGLRLGYTRLFMIWCSGFWVQVVVFGGSEFRVWGLRLRALGLGFQAWVLGVRG